MKLGYALCALLSAAAAAQAQQVQRLEQEKVLKYGKIVSELAVKLGDLPHKINPDVERGMGLRAEDNAGLLIPEKGLTADRIAGLRDGEVIPLGVLYALRMTYIAVDEPAPTDKLRKVMVADENGRELPVVVLPLAVGKIAGRPVLLAYSKDKAPAVAAALEEAEHAGELPLEMEPKGITDTRVTLVIRVLGRWKTAIQVAPTQ
jgi:hypothetical protein